MGCVGLTPAKSSQSLRGQAAFTHISAHGSTVGMHAQQHFFMPP